MKAKAKSAGAQPIVAIDSEVVRQIRQHARSCNTMEVCGVLIGQDRDHRVEVAACIQGENAEGAGAHVTFTQETWEHIYAVKDKQFPNERIVGWYHSHPGFGIFLSEHDTFIHKNFFSSPGQIAWVFDPHSDEEGCFGWADGQIERLTRIALVDRRGGERAEASVKDEPAVASTSQENAGHAPSLEASPKPLRVQRLDIEDTNGGRSSLEQLVARVFFFLASAALGFVLCWQFFPHVVVMGVPIDPMTGQPLDPEMRQLLRDSQAGNEGNSEHPNVTKPGQPAVPDGRAKKGVDAKSK
jgi:proteasome lid subunit RPN8/RPN11